MRPLRTITTRPGLSLQRRQQQETDSKQSTSEYEQASPVDLKRSPRQPSQEPSILTQWNDIFVKEGQGKHQRSVHFAFTGVPLLLGTDTATTTARCQQKQVPSASKPTVKQAKYSKVRKATWCIGAGEPAGMSRQCECVSRQPPWDTQMVRSPVIVRKGPIIMKSSGKMARRVTSDNESPSA